MFHFRHERHEDPKPAADPAPTGTIAIQVLDASQDGSSGLITVRIRSTLTSGNSITNGPIKNYAIDPDTLLAAYGNLANWLIWVKTEHQKYNALFVDMLAELQALKGKSL